MKKHRISVLFGLACLLAVVGVFQLQRSASGQLKQSKRRIEASNKLYRVLIEIGTQDVPKILSENWYGNFAGFNDKIQIRRVSHITMMRVFDKRGREWICPVSAWSDLGNFDRVEIINLKNGCKVFIEGGDGGAAYQATLIFANGALIKRRVCDPLSNGTNEDAFEYTTYNLKARQL